MALVAGRGRLEGSDRILAETALACPWLCLSQTRGLGLGERARPRRLPAAALAPAARLGARESGHVTRAGRGALPEQRAPARSARRLRPAASPTRLPARRARRHDSRRMLQLGSTRILFSRRVYSSNV